MAGEELLFVFIMFIGAMLFAMIFLVLFIMLALFTPSVAYLKAKMKHMPLLAVRRRDRKVHMIRADTYIEGLAVNKKYGGYIIDPDSVYNESRSGVPILPVNAEIGITLNQEVLSMIDGLKSMGYTNIEEAEKDSILYGRCSCGHLGFMNFKKGKDGKPINDKGETIKSAEELVLVCPYEGREDVQEEKQEEAGAVQEAAEPHSDEAGVPDSGSGKDS